MSGEDEKAMRELAAFRYFVALSELPIDDKSIEKRDPPEPDILCRHESDGPIAFELVELCDEEIARRSSDVESNSGDAFYTEDPSPRIVRDKLKKTYKTTHPIELLIYTAERLVTPDDAILCTIRPIVEMNQGLFRRIWFCGEQACVRL